MSKICALDALQILDSRGTPTLSIKLEAEGGYSAISYVPSGASTGEHEACELRDGNKDLFFGKSVKQAVHNALGPIKDQLIGMDVTDQKEIDTLLLRLDGTKNKHRLGANTLLGVSLAATSCGAQVEKKPLYRYISPSSEYTLPCPMINIINGGAHADNTLNFQEFMIRPKGFSSFSSALRAAAEIFYTLKGLLQKKGYPTQVGDEGGFAPPLSSVEEALSLLCQASEQAGYTVGKQITLALDCAASEFFNKDTRLYEEKRKTEEQIEYLALLCQQFPIDSIEDGLDQNDWEGWSQLHTRLGKSVQIVGDDLFVTHADFLKKGIQQSAANAILIKPNQVGTLTETLETIYLAQSHQMGTVISHRSGETEDSFIADLSVAVKSGQIKTGSVSRGERTAKYNRLLWIEKELGKKAVYCGEKNGSF
jgi:enolase